MSGAPDRARIKRLSTIRTFFDLPSFVVSLIVVGFIASLAGFPWAWFIVAAWLASGPLVLIRPVEDALSGGLVQVRRPTPEESQRLSAPWSHVTGAAGIASTEYSLWVHKTRRVNAFAAAGHTVAVTEAALSRLPDEYLEAVLAHELGHHLGGHARASLLRYWYSLPGYFAIGFVSYLDLALFSAIGSGSIAMMIAICAVVLGLLVLLATVNPIVGAVVAILLAIQFITLWLRRLQEYQADLIAAQIGYGPALVRYFGEWEARSPSTASRRKALVSTHPSYADRIRHLQEWLSLQRSSGGPSQSPHNDD